MPTLADLDHELRNWARWAASDARPLECAISAIWRFWIPSGAAREDGWGDASPGERIDDPVDELAAQEIDAYLLRLPVTEWHILRLHYYRHRHQDEITLNRALRALGDAMAVKDGAVLTER